jgi:hypothetical protein
MAFESDLVVEYLDDDRWRLIAPLVYRHDTIPATMHHQVVVPEGFETDFASVPRLPLAYLLAGNTGHRAAVIHDYLYATQPVSRSMADGIFRRALSDDGEPWWRAQIMYAAVRLFGGPAWSRYTSALQVANEEVLKFRYPE